MGCYRFHDLILDVQPAEVEARASLARLWSELSWHEAVDSPDTPGPRLVLRLHERAFEVPPPARPVFTTDSFCGLENGQGFYLSDGESVFHLQQGCRADAYLAPSFFGKPRTLQDTFWSFCLARLLRASGLYCLHAAGLVTCRGDGVLVVGASGSGKTTLALAAIRRGWMYLSDDAVLLRRMGSDGDRCGERGVMALGLRAHVYIDAQATPLHGDLPLGVELPDSTGGRRRRVDLAGRVPLDATRAGRQVPLCVPRLLVLAAISGLERSDLRLADSVTALKSLLVASGPQLWDSSTMNPHLAALTELVRQARVYQLDAGLDVLRNPTVLLEQLETIALGREACHASSSN